MTVQLNQCCLYEKHATSQKHVWTRSSTDMHYTAGQNKASDYIQSSAKQVDTSIRF